VKIYDNDRYQLTAMPGRLNLLSNHSQRSKHSISHQIWASI